MCYEAVVLSKSCHICEAWSVITSIVEQEGIVYNSLYAKKEGSEK